MAANRREILRRLGNPRFRYVCSCGRHVNRLVVAHIWPTNPADPMRQVTVCEACADKVARQNEARTAERARQQVDLLYANIEHRLAAQRPSSYEYRVACAKMKREMGLG